MARKKQQIQDRAVIKTSHIVCTENEARKKWTICTTELINLEQ